MGQGWVLVSGEAVGVPREYCLSRRHNRSNNAVSDGCSTVVDRAKKQKPELASKDNLKVEGKGRAVGLSWIKSLHRLIL